MSIGDAWLRVAPDHPALAGHFPGEPIVPGVLLLDEALHSVDPTAAQWRIASVKFHRIVRPLEVLQLTRSRDPRGELRVEIHAGQALIMSATLERAAP